MSTARARDAIARTWPPWAGGRGSILGTLGGVLLLGVVANMFNILQVDSFFQQLILGLVVLITVATYRTGKAT